MPLPGGAADKFGNRYELCWTIYQFVRMLRGELQSIRIEDPGVKKAEFVVTSAERQEFHQAKRSHPDGKWSLSSLSAGETKLTQSMFTELVGNDARFVFVSSSDAPELRELTERARQAESYEEFETQFLVAKQHRDAFKRIKEQWDRPDTSKAFDVLRRIEIQTSDEQNINEKIRWAICALFLQNTESVYAELRGIAENSIHKILSRDDLVAHLVGRGFQLRKLTNAATSMALVDEVTKAYFGSGRSKLIRKALIPRMTTRTLLDKINDSALGSDFVVVGKAGVGKTACMIELVEALAEQKIPILAFRLDHFKPVSTAWELGKQLGLEESPTLVLGSLAEGRNAVLIVDQLDAVSTISGRNTDFLEAIESLLAEARGLRERVKLHVVVVCRAFDWENDHRLRRMITDKHVKIEVAEFSPEDVKAILSSAGHDIRFFQARQLELLRLPQNLSLFMDAGFSSSTAPVFNTAKDLFDRYWDEKRRAVARRTSPLQDQWPDVVQTLCHEMTSTQQLSVPREKLDQIASDYLSQMASEGVVSFSNQRYAFSHESFFDYCFARTFVRDNRPLVEFLLSSEQHLFRRAQIRQVFAYLRDSDRSRYSVELSALFSDLRIRIHLKDLAAALIFSMSDPGEDEWNIFYPLLKIQIVAISESQPDREKLAALIWRYFFCSQSWFYFIHARGFIADWLASSNGHIVHMGVNYLRFHQRHAGDIVAGLLKPYMAKGGDWVPRLRFIMELADHENSRTLFDMFLQLIDDGTLDEARDRLPSNGTFWSMLYGLAKARPEWIPEVVSHWLKRRLVLVQKSNDEVGDIKWRELFENDPFGSEHFHDSASKAPQIFVQEILPVILKISDAALYHPDGEPPKRDACWPILFDSEYESIDGAIRNALVTALGLLAKDQPSKLQDTIFELRKRDTYIANYFLLSIYIAGSNHFFKDAVGLLCDEPWRFHCGFSDSPYWVAMQLIKTITPLISLEDRVKLETVILAYSSRYERSPDGYKLLGRARFDLLSAIPNECRTTNAQARFEELERKFEEPHSAPHGIRAHFVGSPIEEKIGEKMTDEQWLKAIAKYHTEERPNRWAEPDKGGAWELACMLEKLVRNEPERFARLSLLFPDCTNPAYIERVLAGLKDTSLEMETKLAVCRKAYLESPDVCGKSIADILGNIEENLPEDTVQMLGWLATEHTDPEKELWDVKTSSGHYYYGGEIHGCGINTVRGRAADAIRDLIFTNAEYISRFRGVLDAIVQDKSLSVRSCVASTLIAVAQSDKSLAMELFLKLADADERLLATRDADRFIYYGLREDFKTLRPLIERMLKSTNANVNEAGARLVSLAALYHKSAEDLVDVAMAGAASHRLGVAKVASSNIANNDCRGWCEEKLLVLFNDRDTDVRLEAATCFRYLKDMPLEAYEALITAFCHSPAYQEGTFSLLYILEESLHRLPGITCLACGTFLERFSDEAKNVSTRRAADVHYVPKLVFRMYHQHQNDEWASRCLDLIDKMCLEGIHDVHSGLDEFER